VHARERGRGRHPKPPARRGLLAPKRRAGGFGGVQDVLGMRQECEAVLGRVACGVVR
jgi:hypothetical protein